MIRIGIVAFSQKGGELAGYLREAYRERGYEAQGYLSGRHQMAGMEPFGDLPDLTARLFAEKDLLLFIGACGIAVRAVAPYIESKMKDPGVAVADECGRYVISLLAGHVGGANAFTALTADLLGAEPVITTATDRNGVFAVDCWAQKQGLRIMEPAGIVEISSRLLAGEPVGLSSDLPIAGSLPPGLIRQERAVEEAGIRAGIVISYDMDTARCRFPIVLPLLPMDLVVGMGCRKGIGYESLRAFLERVLSENGLLPERVGLLCSIRAKETEDGLVKLARSLGVAFETWTAQELMDAAGSFAASSFVQARMGTDNVCERSAALSSRGGCRLVAKQQENGMTLAVYRREIRPVFGQL